MNTNESEIKTDFSNFLKGCADLNSSRNYIGGLNTISKIINEIDPEFENFWDLDSAQVLESYKDKLNKNKEYIELNKKGKNMYSNAFKWYLMYLKAKTYFLNSTNITYNENLIIKSTFFLQTVYYGAPGTGKSNEIKELTGEGKDGVRFDKDSTFRITFHPDSDYASFVGAYKPTWREEDGTEGKIIYEFRPQPFFKAYSYAWKNPDKNVALIIEEINRGNCAQIFGDIFQLLDRDDDGLSKYPIEADDDMQKFLKNSFEGKSDDKKAIADDDKDAINSKYSEHYEDAFVKIKMGAILSLPKNLSILATMNTSDQSLFPMDSAFKRRWDWEYMPIKNAGLNWKIELDDKHKLIDWWYFLERINKEISELTASEDKQLGYFFCQPDKFAEPDETKRGEGAEYDLISAKRFVDKVVFYLWNDVFKDYAYEPKCCKDSDSKVVLFAQFYGNDGKSINTDVLAQFFSMLTTENEKSLVKLKETETSPEEETKPEDEATPEDESTPDYGEDEKPIFS